MDDTKHSETGYIFKLLQEEASESDLFPDKTHEEVKNTLFNLIETSEKGITIGLEGGWGSGKTTVINFLNRAIKDSKKKTLFFSFDAWAHEGDPLRRIFLESLINEIDPEKKDENLCKLLKEISGRKKIVEVKTEKKTSKFADFLAITTLLVPMGAALLSALNYDTLLSPWGNWDKSANWTFIFGLLFSLAPALFIFYWWLFGKKDKDGKPEWSLILSNSTEDYTQDITEDGEKSSIEFENYFQKILAYSVGKNEKKYERAIIVVDNLDRVDSAHANQLWSTLQTFFQHRSKKNNNLGDWMECLWFIVPYDREGLSRIWMTKNDNTDEINHQNVAQSFLNKCFQIRAEVPAPVMSAWNEYTIHSVNKALIDWPGADKDIVIRTYKRHASRLDKSPTPREINNFVNQVGFIGMRWGGIMSTESISLYAILRKEYTENTLRNKLLKDIELPDKFEAIKNVQDLKQELAGLLFGVSKEKGVELLLEPEINKSIRNGDGEIIKNLIQVHGEAFWITWDAIKSSLLPNNSHSEEYRISATKSMYAGMFGHFEKIQNELADLEETWRNSIESWNFNRLDYTDSLVIISDISKNKPEFIEWLHRTISSKLIKLIEQIGSSTEFTPEQLTQLSLLTTFLTENNKPIKRMLYPKLDAVNWANWLNILSLNKISLPNILPAKGTIEEIGNQYLESSVTLPPDNLTLLENTYKVYPDSAEWVSVISNLVAWANKPNRELGNDLAYQLMLHLYSYNNTQSKQLIKTCISEQAFWTRGKLETLESTPTLPLLIGCILGEKLQENLIISTDIHTYWSESDNSNEKINHAFDTFIQTNQLKEFWEIAKDSKNIFAIAVLTTKTDTNELYSYKESVLSLENYYDWFDGDQHAKIISRLCELGTVNKALDDIKNNPSGYSYTLYLLQQYGTTKTIDIVNKFLSAISTEYWGKSFIEDDYLLACVLNDRVKLDHKYTEAFKDFFSKSINEQNTTDWQWKNFEGLLKKTIDQDLLLEELTSEFFSKDEDTLSDLGFSALSSHMTIHIKNITQTKIMTRVCDWIDDKKWDRIIWLISSKPKVNAPPLEGLSSRVSEAFNNEENNVHISTIEALAKLFNIEIIKNNNDEKIE